MGSRLEIARAFARGRWGRQAVNGYVPDCPIETAQEFEDRFAERNALGLNLSDARAEAERELAGGTSSYPGYSFGLSSGTMGRSGVFITHEHERDAWVGTVLGKFLPLRMLLGADVALVLKHNSRLYTDVVKTRGVRLHYFNAAVPVEEWVAKLCALAPDVLVGPPSILEQIAASARGSLRPALLLAGAEPLFPQDRAFLTEAYGVAPRVIYQAKEGFLAAECSLGGVHLNEDIVRFEKLNLQGARFVPVISDFRRTSQIYRRFRMDDVLVASSDSCACGSPFARVDSVEGRANDVLLLGDRTVFPLEVNQVMSKAGRDYRVSQVTGDRVSVACERGVPDDALSALQLLIPGASISAEGYLRPVCGEKRRRVQRLFDPHNDWLRHFTVSRNVASGL